MVIIGIDPGLSGAIGYLSNEMKMVVDMPVLKIEGKRTKSRKTGKVTVKKKNIYDITRIKELLAEYKKTALDMNDKIEVWIEKSQPMPDQGGVSNFNYGFGFGVLQAVTTCCEIPFQLIHPVTWKKKIMFGQGKEKDASVYKAQQLFPELQFRGPRGGLLDGRAEAMLIAEYGRLYSLSINSF